MYGKCDCFVIQMLYVYSCVHLVAVLNSAFCMNCRLLILVQDARGDHMEEAYYRASLIGSHECLLRFTPPCCGECFYYLLVVVY